MKILCLLIKFYIKNYAMSFLIYKNRFPIKTDL